MPILIVIAVFHWLISGALVIAAIATEDLWLIALALVVAIAGILFFALEKVISLLSDIRNAVTGENVQTSPLPDAEKQDQKAGTLDPDTQFIQDDLDRLRAGLPPVRKPT